MQFQLKADAPNKVEHGFGGRSFVCVRGEEPFECRETDWPALERTGHFEPYLAPQPAPTPETDKPADKAKK